MTITEADARAITMKLSVALRLTVAVTALTFVLGFAAGFAHSDTLILTQAHGYQLPANADTARVLRTPTSVWSPIADVQPVERIQVCVDDATVAIGSTTTCTTRVPGRTDNWQLKSLAIPPPLPKFGTTPFTWNAVTQSTTNEPMAIAGYMVTVRRQDCDTSAVPNCAVAPNDAPLDVGNVLTFTVPNVARVACMTVQAYTSARDLGLLSDELCKPAEFPKLIPAKVTGLR